MLSIRQNINDGILDENTRLIQTAACCLRKVQQNIFSNEVVELQDFTLNEKLGICLSMLLAEMPEDKQNVVLFQAGGTQ